MSRDKTDADVEFIRSLAAILKESDLGEIEVEREYGENDELMVRLSRSGPAPAAAPAPAPMASAPQPAKAAAAAPAPAAPAPTADPASTPGAVPSPMVGTAYLSPEPGAPAFVTVGDKITKGQTVLIIEAMKTMNQIAAPHDGTLRVMLVGDGDPVEFGMPLMVIE